MKSPSCSIIIRAYNEAAHLPRLLDGILQQTIQDVEIILVDSGSTDGTLEAAARYPVRVEHIAPQEFTFGRSLNLGLAAAHCELAVIASAHVYPVYPDWLERLLAPFADPQVGLTYGKQRGGQTTKFSEQQIFAHWFADVSQPRQSYPFCNNANAAIRRSLWEKQPYDETLTGLEDLAWASAIQAQGWAIAYVAEAEIAHIHNETRPGVYNRYRREAMAFRKIFPKERFSFLDFLRLSTGNIASDLYHAARRGALLPSFNSIFWFRLAQFWGTYQGFRRPGPVTAQLRQTFYYPRSLRAADPATPRPVSPIDYSSKTTDK